MSCFPYLQLGGKVVFLLSHDNQALWNHNVPIPLFTTLWQISLFLLSHDNQALRNHNVLIPFLTTRSSVFLLSPG